MKEADYLRALYRERRYDIAILMLAAMFPIHRSFTSVVLMVAFGLVAGKSYYDSAWRRKQISPTAWAYFLITSGFGLFAVVSLLYSSDVKTGIDFLVANSYLLIYPLLILLFARDLSERDVDIIVFAFIFACLCLSVYLHVKFYQAGLFTEIRQVNYSIFPFREMLLRNRYHPTYVSMWFLFSALFIVQYLFRHKLRLLAIVGLICCAVFFVTTSVLMSVKVTTIGFMLALLVLIYVVVSNKILVLGSYLVVFAMFALSISQVSFLRARFVDEFKDTKLLAPVGVATNSLNIRVGIYQCSWRVFQDNWLVGTGIGDAQHALNACYDSFDTNVYRESTYNSHNNYLGVAVSTGIVGLTLFLVMLIFHLARSITNNNVVFLIFLVFVMVCLLGENILSRHHGVVFYSLFCSLFSRQNLQQEKVR
ncbi:MAG TPA: O-antigen ligase family protein [Chryseolinea sp.]|nr:O-antigen ligase family protein [Chryseolinea sp.]